MENATTHGMIELCLSKRFDRLVPLPERWFPYYSTVERGTP